MKKITAVIILTLIAMACLAQASWAGDSATIGVSITIPAIPGVNAPPFIAKEGNQAGPLDAAQAKIGENATRDKPNDLRNDANGVIVEEEKNDGILLADGSTSYSVTTTVYSR